jgi:hypothetical protein
MGFKLNYNDFNLYAEKPADIYVQDPDTVISTSGFNVLQDETFLSKHEGAGTIGTTFQYTAFWKFPTMPPRYSHCFPWGITDTDGVPSDMRDIVVGPAKCVYIDIGATNGNVSRFLLRQVWGTVGTSLVSHDTIPFPGGGPLNDNQYKTVITGTPELITADVIDVDGGHGAPGAIIISASVIPQNPSPLTYIVGFSSWQSSSLNSYMDSVIGPLWQGLDGEIETPKGYYLQLLRDSQSGKR